MASQNRTHPSQPGELSIRAFIRDRFGLVVNRVDSLYPWQAAPQVEVLPDTTGLPGDAKDYLRPDNARLLEFAKRYARCDPAVTNGSVWTPDKISAHNLLFFRGDNPWIFQQRMRSGNELAYALTYYHALNGPERWVLEQLAEDGLFGAYTVEVDGRLVSRDLLDSASEIAFLKAHAELGGKTEAVIDIGAGYGRLAHRMAEAQACARVYATDAFPVSTFISEYYLRFRSSPATVVPLDEVEAILAQVQLATNVHSFSECRPAAIRWWVSRLARSNVRYLFVVPNRSTQDGRCLTNGNVDMDELFMEFGYRLACRSPRYADPIVQRYGVDPSLMSVFELG